MTPGPEVLKSRSNDLICREVDGKLVGLDLRSSRYFSLNPAGTALWRLLEGGAQASDLVEALVNEHQIAPEAAEVDVQTFIASLLEQDLLE